MFRKKVTLFIDPQTELPDKLDKVIPDLKTVGVEYRVDGFEDLRGKYPFYRECGYPYSAMKICRQNDKKNQ